MLNAEKLKKRFYISLVFYFLFGTALLLILDNAVSTNFEQKKQNFIICTQTYLYGITYSVSVDYK